MNNSEFHKRIRQEKPYQEMYSFIISEFAKGEILSLDAVLRRYYDKNPTSATFDQWDTQSLFFSVVTSLSQEGKIHFHREFLTGEGYMIDGDLTEKPAQTQQRIQEER